MTVLLVSTADSAESWCEALLQTDMPLPLRVWPDVGDPADVEYVIAAKPPAGLLSGFPNLKAILSLWAGVDHITSDPDWPKDVPIYRMIEPGLTDGMVEFVLSQVLNLHLNNYAIVAAQARQDWLRAPRGAFGHEPLIHDRRVTVLGLGEMGRNAAEALSRTGFRVTGWSRSQKRIAGIDCLAGSDGFDQALEGAEILVNLLPLTAETEDILNADAFARMPKGSYLLNVGRGQHVVDQDLIAALDSGQLDHAVLDVFRKEPLEQGHPFWSHPKITIYPHIASVTRVKTGVVSLAARLKTLLAGGKPEGLFDPERGY